MSDSNNDSGNLSLSCLVSSIKSEESEVSEVEGDLETVESYQFEAVASSYLPYFTVKAPMSNNRPLPIFGEKSCVGLIALELAPTVNYRLIDRTVAQKYKKTRF